MACAYPCACSWRGACILCLRTDILPQPVICPAARPRLVFKRMVLHLGEIRGNKLGRCTYRSIVCTSGRRIMFVGDIKKRAWLGTAKGPLTNSKCAVDTSCNSCLPSPKHLWRAFDTIRGSICYRSRPHCPPDNVCIGGGRHSLPDCVFRGANALVPPFGVDPYRHGISSNLDDCVVAAFDFHSHNIQESKITATRL